MEILRKCLRLTTCAPIYRHSPLLVFPFFSSFFPSIIVCFLVALYDAFFHLRFSWFFFSGRILYRICGKNKSRKNICTYHLYLENIKHIRKMYPPAPKAYPCAIFFQSNPTSIVSALLVLSCLYSYPCTMLKLLLLVRT